MHIAVYSGSFNPLHEGHLAILEYLSGRFDRTYLIVSPQNPFKDEANRDSARRRFEDARGVLELRPELNATADDIELSMQPPQYTIRTLDALKAREPGNDFTFIGGADLLPRWRGWREYRRILLEYGVLIFPREGFDAPALIASLLEEDPGYRIGFASGFTPVNISSTQIREATR